MIYLIEFNQIVRKKISCGGLYQMNQMNMNPRKEATDICDDKIQNKKRIITKKSSNNTLQRKRQKMKVDYREKLLMTSG